MKSLTIALLQMKGFGFDQAENLAKGEIFCREAQALGADIALFPEMWNIGYTFFQKQNADSLAQWLDQAIETDGSFVRHFRELAAELEMAIAITYLQRWDERPRNVVSLIDRRGQVLFTYAKLHTCEFDKESALTPGEDFYVAALDTTVGTVQVGAMICYDREFPESARLLMLKGAEIILTPNACEMELNRLSQFRSRAMENMLGVALANYAAPQENGHSVAYDGIAYVDDRPRDTLVVEAGDAEGVYLARFDLDRLRDWRQKEGWGNAYRRPRRYGLLVSEAVMPPFIRSDATH